MGAKYNQSGGAIAQVEQPDASLLKTTAMSPVDGVGNKVSVETLVANTNKQIAIPAGCNAVHIDSAINAPVYFKLDEAWGAIPAGGVYVVGGFIKGSAEVVRKLSAEAIGAAHTLNLICASPGALTIEFLLL